MNGQSQLRANYARAAIAAVLALCVAALAGLWQAASTQAAPGQMGTPGTTPSTGYGPVRARSAVYPPQELPLRFDHSRHLRQGMQCTQCHTQATTSQRAGDRLLPAATTCDSCHQSQHPVPIAAQAKDNEPACSMCHAGADDAARRITASVRLPSARLRFSHALHVAKEVGAACEDCHKQMDKVRLATDLQLPKEQDCLTCHDGQAKEGHATDQCSACHPSGPGGQLLTRSLDDVTAPALMPRANNHWRGAAHDLSFVRDHKSVANANPQLCDNCHGEDDCLDCHAGVMRPMRIHAGDYLTRHGIDARMGNTDCQSCHRLQDDCLSCHERTGLGSTGTESAFGVGSNADFHPQGWTQPGSLSSHAFAAQRNLGACVSCHTEDTCLACHATAGGQTPGLGVSPHGPGFRSSLRCQTLANRNRRACLQCHAPSESALDCR